MNKKSTIGMVLLVAMILAKAFLFEYEPNEAFTANVRSSVNQVSTALDYSEKHPVTLNNPSDLLLAANFNTPDLSDFELKQLRKDETTVKEVNGQVAVIEDVQAGDEVIPMDFVSNTGYGRWRLTTPEKNVPNESAPLFEGKVPLDRGNTITDNIARMFPRTP